MLIIVGDDAARRIESLRTQLERIERKVDTLMATTEQALETLATTVSDAITALNEAKALAADAQARAQKVIDDDAITDAQQIADAQAVLDADHAGRIGEIQQRLADALSVPEVPVEPPVIDEPQTPTEPTEPQTPTEPTA